MPRDLHAFDYIRNYYGVPAEKGRRVEYTGNGSPHQGTITGIEGAHVLIKLDGQKSARPYHPTWELRYLETESTP